MIDDPEHKIEKLAHEGAVAVLSARSYSSGPFQGIPAEGVGGDPEFNLRKNRDKPPPSYAPMTLEAIIAQKVPEAIEANRRPRHTWSAEARNEVERLENQGVMVEGFVNEAHPAGPTAANAHMQDMARRDWIVSLVSHPDDERSKSVIAVITPRVRAAHPEWTINVLKALALERQRVRLSGWLLWGQPTLFRIAKAATRWRIHPTMNIEVLDGHGWKPLSDAAPQE